MTRFASRAAMSLVGRRVKNAGLSPMFQSQERRWKSVSAASSLLKKEESATCPFSGSSGNSQDPPKLVRAPSLPFFGSTIPAYSGTPPWSFHEMYDFVRGMNRKFGKFYSYGFPGFGEGLHGTMHVTVDPKEMLKVVRAEGAYPSGAVQRLWVVHELLKAVNSPLVDPITKDLGIFGQGERWKTQRTFLQTGMLDPRTAKGYVAGIAAAASLASKNAILPHNKSNFGHFLNLCSFDMFCSFMLGELTECTKGTYQDNKAFGAVGKSAQHEENLKFCRNAIKVTADSTNILVSAKEQVAYRVGYETALFKEMKETWKECRDLARKKLRSFEKRYEAGELTELEQHSYLANALDRLKSTGSDISYEEVMELAFISLFVGTDTTTGVTAWNIMHLALNPDVQEKLYDELVEAVQATDGKITAATLERKNTPYLHAVLRETHRITPPFPQQSVKTVLDDEGVVIHEEKLPKGSVVALNYRWNDPQVLGDALEFKPGRFFSDSVEERKGTDLEDMDHALFRDPFGQGARRCPGSRIATNEVLCMVSQLVLDYKIRPPSYIQTLSDVKYGFTALLSPIITDIHLYPRNSHQ